MIISSILTGYITILYSIKQISDVKQIWSEKWIFCIYFPKSLINMSNIFILSLVKKANGNVQINFTFNPLFSQIYDVDKYSTISCVIYSIIVFWRHSAPITIPSYTVPNKWCRNTVLCSLLYCTYCCNYLLLL